MARAEEEQQDTAQQDTAREALLASLARGALIGLATWAGVGALPALIAGPAAAAAGALERWGGRGGWRRPGAVLLTAPVVAGLAFAMAYQGLYAHMARYGFREARESVIAGRFVPWRAGVLSRLRVGSARP